MVCLTEIIRPCAPKPLPPDFPSTLDNISGMSLTQDSISIILDWVSEGIGYVNIVLFEFFPAGFRVYERQESISGAMSAEFKDLSLGLKAFWYRIETDTEVSDWSQITTDFVAGITGEVVTHHGDKVIHTHNSITETILHTRSQLYFIHEDGYLMSEDGYNLSI